MSLDYYGPKRRLRGACGFTLIEVLVSLGIVSVALLAGIRATDSLVSKSRLQSQNTIGIVLSLALCLRHVI